MSPQIVGSVVQDFHQLFGNGSATGLSDGELVDRYVSYRDERAFRTLVAIHGPMVLGVCRRILSRPEDVDDAVQATFLVFLQKAKTLRNPSSVGGWLHGVAIKVATRCRKEVARRPPIERLAQINFSPTTDHESLTIIDEELSRLPAIYRDPIILCHVEGQTHDQAASRLGWPVGTVRSRLSRGRERLRSRLTRRGLAPSIGLPQITITPLGEYLMAKTFGLLANPSEVALRLQILTQGVLSTMLLTSLTQAGVMILGVVVGVGGTVLIGASQLEQQTTQKAAAQKDEKAALSKTQPCASPLADPLRGKSPDELEARLKIAIARSKSFPLESGKDGDLPNHAMIRESMHEDVILIQAEIDAEKQEIADELERLSAELRMKEAKIKEAVAREELATAVTKINQRLSLSRQGVVSAGDITKGETELEIEQAGVEVARADLNRTEVAIRIAKQRFKRLSTLPKSISEIRLETKTVEPVSTSPFKR